MNLSGQVALVTGVSREGQIGQAVAKALAASGANLVLVARHENRLGERLEEVRAVGVKAVAVVADVGTEEGARKAVTAAKDTFGRIDVLVNLAGGLTVYKPAVEHGWTEWWQEIQNNLASAFLMCREVFPVMKQQGGGAIINFSRAGLPQASMLAYNCAKAGVDALTRTYALEGREANIRVNAVAPGLTDTRANLTAMQPKDTTKWTSREDIAEVVLFLASPQAHGITGQVIPVAGKGI